MTASIATAAIAAVVVAAVTGSWCGSLGCHAVCVSCVAHIVSDGSVCDFDGHKSRIKEVQEAWETRNVLYFQSCRSDGITALQHVDGVLHVKHRE